MVVMSGILKRHYLSWLWFRDSSWWESTGKTKLKAGIRNSALGQNIKDYKLGTTCTEKVDY